MKHRLNTEMKIRVPSVFYPWPQLPPDFFLSLSFISVGKIGQVYRGRKADGHLGS
jgi:hypothetical protein